jgi:hypothetical protein
MRRRLWQWGWWTATAVLAVGAAAALAWAIALPLTLEVQPPKSDELITPPIPSPTQSVDATAVPPLAQLQTMWERFSPRTAAPAAGAGAKTASQSLQLLGIAMEPPTGYAIFRNPTDRSVIVCRQGEMKEGITLKSIDANEVVIIRNGALQKFPTPKWPQAEVTP